MTPESTQRINQSAADMVESFNLLAAAMMQIATGGSPSNMLALMESLQKIDKVIAALERTTVTTKYFRDASKDALKELSW
jgi:hypothetical protein